MIFASGCLSQHQSVATDVDVRSWNAPAVIQYANTDTLILQDLNLFIRCDARFTADSLPLYVTLLTPDSLLYEERVVLRIPSREHPAAITPVLECPYRRRICLLRQGNYTFVIRPEHPQQGIEAIGIHLLKSE